MGGSATPEIERLLRAHYGRLLAFLASRTGDPTAAEDALSEAFSRALTAWRDGVPEHPEAWLLRTARNWLIDQARRHRREDRREAAMEEAARQGAEMAERETFPDERIKLLFVCAHPAIHPGDRTPLMLQLVLGLSAHEIAAAYLVPAATMSQRLVRAKEKIRLAGIEFRVPEAEELPDRTASVLEAVYAAYVRASENRHAVAPPVESMADEALWLARVVAEAMPEEPEALGLFALLLHTEARAPAARADDGTYVPLRDQDATRWRADLRREADIVLNRASAIGRPGRYQLEALIQSAHSARVADGIDARAAIATLYNALLRIAPSVGAQVGAAVAYADLEGPASGLRRLDEVPDGARERYQPFWAARAHLLAEAGRPGEAIKAYDRAMAMATDASVRSYLAAQRSRLASA